MNIEVYGVIYKITNNIDNKVYIGQTSGSFNYRYSGSNWWKHTNNKHLKSSALKYGEKNFSINIKFDVAFSKEELDEKETYWIKYYNATNNKFGYNLKDGGANGKPNAETLARMTKINRKRGLMARGIPRPGVGLLISKTKQKTFINEFTKEYAENVQILLDSGIRKQETCIKCNISIWQLDRIIETYNLTYDSTPSMKGNFKEKHHNYGKPNSEESKVKVTETHMKNFTERFDKEVIKISDMLKNKVSISEISRIYNCSRGTMRKVIKHYGLESYGFNVKKTLTL